MSDKLLKQKIADYWNNQPCNVKHSNKSVGTKEYFEEITKKKYFVEPHIPVFAGFYLWQGKRVLEIGCGIGTDAAEFAKHGAEYVGVDLSKESIELAKQRFIIDDLQGEFHTYNAEDDLTWLGKFDLVYSAGVLHHYPDVTAIVKNIHQVLKQDGEFRFVVYAKNSWKYAMIQKGLDQFEAQSGCPYAKAYTKEEIYNLVDSLFNIVRIRQDHVFMYNVEKYKQHIYELEPWFAAMPEDMRNTVKEYLGWHFLVKAIKI
jgi:2-polyprenyl-3-methyl-5-hydroxy-6-metoxy-1,4-benzoquinol methylase